MKETYYRLLVGHNSTFTDFLTEQTRAAARYIGCKIPKDNDGRSTGVSVGENVLFTTDVLKTVISSRTTNKIWSTTLIFLKDQG